jgi:hypothetical protein
LLLAYAASQYVIAAFDGSFVCAFGSAEENLSRILLKRETLS